MTPERVRFSSHPNVFKVATTRCSNPECDCTSVQVALTELPREASVGGRMRIKFSFDADVWQEPAVPEGRPAEETAIIEEFLRDYPPTAKEALQKNVRRKRNWAVRLRTARIDSRKVMEGALVSWMSIVEEAGDLIAGGHAVEFSVEVGGFTYYVEDHYCANPDCSCRAVHLMFFKLLDGKGSETAEIRQVFVARLSFDGEVSIEELVFETPIAEAQEVLAAWQAKYGQEPMDDFKWRCEKIKALTRQSMPIRRSAEALLDSVTPPIVRPVRPGRNDPCTCGSGKKYKKCCGA